MIQFSIIYSVSLMVISDGIRFCMADSKQVNNQSGKVGDSHSIETTKSLLNKDHGKRFIFRRWLNPIVTIMIHGIPEESNSWGMNKENDNKEHIRDFEKKLLIIEKQLNNISELINVEERLNSGAEFEDNLSKIIRRLDAIEDRLIKNKKIEELRFDDVLFNNNRNDIVCDGQRRGYHHKHSNIIIQTNCGFSKENFNRSWIEYDSGFGKIREGYFWIGNKIIHRLTSQENYTLRIDLRNDQNDTRWAEYDNFKLESENKGYILKIDGYSGNAGDSLSEQSNGENFNTFDQNYDICNAVTGVGWWYGRKSCFDGNLNGRSGEIQWNTWKTKIIATQMSLRLKNIV